MGAFWKINKTNAKQNGNDAGGKKVDVRIIRCDGFKEDEKVNEVN